MASLLRSPKSGSDWGPNELLAYNVNIQFQTAIAFFGFDPQPSDDIDNEILTKLNADDMTNGTNYKFVRYMDLAMDSVSSEESAVVDFAVLLLTMLNYATRTMLTRTRTDIPLTICGEQRYAKTDVCVEDEEGDIILLVHVDKRNKERKDPESRLVAQAIAAYQAINTRRTRVLGQVALDDIVIPGIILVGSSPTFYHICVTKEFAEAVAQGRYPPTPTTLYAHLPAVPRPARRLSEGMKPLDNRQHILACYEAFKTEIVDWHYNHGE